jgi:hypothetical protein
MFRMGFVLALAVLYAANTASAKSLPSDTKDDGLVAFSSWLNDVELALQINTDPVLRSVVCRIPFTNFTPGTLAKATHLSRGRVMQAVSKLMDMGLVKIVSGDKGRPIVVPASDEIRQKLRRWVYDWCTTDNECEVAR